MIIQKFKKLILLAIWLITMPITTIALCSWSLGWDKPLCYVIDKFDDLTEWVVK